MKRLLMYKKKNSIPDEGLHQFAFIKSKLSFICDDYSNNTLSIISFTGNTKEFSNMIVKMFDDDTNVNNTLSKAFNIKKPTKNSTKNTLKKIVFFNEFNVTKDTNSDTIVDYLTMNKEIKKKDNYINNIPIRKQSDTPLPSLKTYSKVKPYISTEFVTEDKELSKKPTQASCPKIDTYIPQIYFNKEKLNIIACYDYYTDGTLKLLSVDLLSLYSLQDIAYVLVGLFNEESNINDVLLKTFDADEKLRMIRFTFNNVYFAVTANTTVTGIMNRYRVLKNN